MRNQLHAAWRARRVLIIGHEGRSALAMQALLEELGAKCARLSPCADADTLCHALTKGRIGVVIVPQLRMLCAQGDLPAQLSALLLLLSECREAGVPLVLLLSDAAVNKAVNCPWYVREEDPIGGETYEGLVHSILQLCADGASRALLGDAVNTLCIRHMPLLGHGHPACAAYSEWCRALDERRLIDVSAPGAQGIFLDPVDLYACALLLGARFLLGDHTCTGIFNLGAGPDNRIANRTAALRLIRDHGGTRPIRESQSPAEPAPPLLDGSRARLLCGAQPQLPAGMALQRLMALERAARISPQEELLCLQRQARDYLASLQ